MANKSSDNPRVVRRMTMEVRSSKQSAVESVRLKRDIKGQNRSGTGNAPGRK